jgi:hypothetical protein
MSAHRSAVFHRTFGGVCWALTVLTVLSCPVRLPHCNLQTKNAGRSCTSVSLPILCTNRSSLNLLHSVKNRAPAAIQVSPTIPLFQNFLLILFLRSPQNNYSEKYEYYIFHYNHPHPYPQAQERQESQFRAPRQRVEDFEELHEYRGRKRKEFEERIRRTRGSMSVLIYSLVLIPYRPYLS